VDPRTAEDSVGTRVELGDTCLEERRRPEVVVCGPGEVLAACELEGAPEVVDRAPIAITSVVADALVASGVFAADRVRPVVGRVVADRQLEVRVRLSEE